MERAYEAAVGAQGSPNLPTGLPLFNPFASMRMTLQVKEDRPWYWEAKLRLAKRGWYSAMSAARLGVDYRTGFIVEPQAVEGNRAENPDALTNPDIETTGQTILIIIITAAFLIFCLKIFEAAKAIRMRRSESFSSLQQTGDGSTAVGTGGSTDGSTDAKEKVEAPAPAATPGKADALTPLAILVVGLSMGSEFATGTYMTMLAPFFPGEAAARGVPSVVNGVIFSAHPAAVVLFAQMSPHLLRRFAPFNILSVTLLLQCAMTASMGLVDAMREPLGFVLICATLRFGMGIATAINLATYQAVVLQSVPHALVGTAMGLLSAARASATSTGPGLAGFLYDYGGFPLPFVAVSAAFLVQALLVNLLVWAVPADKLPCARPKLPSVWKLLRLPVMWGLGAVQLLIWSSIFGLEPIYQPYLSRKPHYLTVSAIGAILITDSAALAVSASLINAVTSRFIDPQYQQAIGIWGIAAGVMIVGSSPHLLHLPVTVTTVIIGLVVLGTAQGMAMPAQPVVALRVLKKDAGLERKDVAGAMVSAFLTISMIGASLTPLVTTALEQWIKFGGTTEAISIFVAVAYLPIFIWLMRYMD